MNTNPSIEMLSGQFQEFLNLSGQSRPDYIASLGIPAEGGLSTISDSISEVPDLLTAIYSSVAGTNSDEEEPSLIEFIPGYRLIHIGEYEQEMQVLAGILEEKEQHVDGVILPILTNYGSDYICYHRSADGTERICDLLHDYGDLVVMYDSPQKFLETLCEFYKQEVYFLDEEGFLDCDLVKEGEVGAALNPAAQYWAE